MKKLFSLITVLVLSLLIAVPAMAGELVVDNADLLTDTEEYDLEASLIDAGAYYSTDVVVVTTDDLEGKSRVAYADDFLDYNGYSGNGVLMLISMDPADRSVYISTKGRGLAAYSDADIDAALDRIVPYLSDGDYYTACETFASITKDQLSGKSISSRNGLEGFGWGMAIIIAVGIAAVITLIVISIMKKKHKSVAAGTEASNYLVPGSLSVTSSRDTFLYFTITKVPLPKNDNNNHSGHFSSSGSFHGGGGRSF